MVLKLILISFTALQFFAFVDGNIRSDPIVVLSCDPVGTWMRHRHRCICRPQFHGIHCERIFRCVSGKPRNVSCSYPEAEDLEAASKRCLIGIADFIEVCECFDGYTGPLCERQIDRPPVRLIFPPRHHQSMPRPYIEREEYDVDDMHADDAVSIWSPDNGHWIAFLLLHLVLVMIAVISTAVAMMCYFHRKKARYHAVDDLSLSLEKASSDEQEGVSLPPSYDDVVPKTRSTEIVATGDGKFATLLVTTSEDQQQHLHV